MYLSSRNLRNCGLLRSDTCWHKIAVDQSQSMLARSYLICAVICHWHRNREGAVGAAYLQLWCYVDSAPQPSARTEKLLIFKFLFHFISKNAKEWKIRGLKPVRKLDLRAPQVSLSLSWTTTGKCQLSPPSLKIAPLPVDVNEGASEHRAHRAASWSWLVLFVISVFKCVQASAIYDVFR